MPKPAAKSVPRPPEETRRARRWAYLDSVLALGEVRVALLGLLQSALSVLGRQTSANGAGGLGPQVKRLVGLVLVEQAELVALLDVDDGEDASNGLAQIVAIGPAILAKGGPPGYRGLDISLLAAYSGARHVHAVELGARRGDLLDAQLAQLSLELAELLHQLVLVLAPERTGLDLGGGLW